VTFSLHYTVAHESLYWFYIHDILPAKILYYSVDNIIDQCLIKNRFPAPTWTT